MSHHKSKILIIGGTGTLGRFIVDASAKSGHKTFALIREATLSDPIKGPLIEGFKNSGVTVLIGDIYDHESLVQAIKHVSVVISAVGSGQIADQVNILAAIKEVGGVKRFFPSEFGNDVDRSNAVEPAKSSLDVKVSIRRTIEAEGIPYTYVVANSFSGYFLPNFLQPGATVPPREEITILGTGHAKAVFNAEEDIGTYTIRAVDDHRTLNKILYIKPPVNIITFNELVSIWEEKIGTVLTKTYTPEKKVLEDIAETPDVPAAIAHAIFVLGDQTNYEIDPAVGVEASEIYPHVKIITVDEYLNRFV
ncbi:hypothetical protein ACHQM5_023066 [Ranunculus cassubicifolius]